MRLFDIVKQMPEWPEESGEYACWMAFGHSTEAVAFFDCKPFAGPWLRHTALGAWGHSYSCPTDAATAFVTRSQWLAYQYSAQAQQVVGPPHDPWAAEQSAKYPAYWREIPAHWTHLDTYRVNELFPVQDNSGAVLHARKKLLLPGVRTGAKGMEKDVAEAVSTLQCFLNK